MAVDRVDLNLQMFSSKVEFLGFATSWAAFVFTNQQSTELVCDNSYAMK